MPTTQSRRSIAKSLSISQSLLVQGSDAVRECAVCVNALSIPICMKTLNPQASRTLTSRVYKRIMTLTLVQILSHFTIMQPPASSTSSPASTLSTWAAWNLTISRNSVPHRVAEMKLNACSNQLLRNYAVWLAIWRVSRSKMRRATKGFQQTNNK